MKIKSTVFFSIILVAAFVTSCEVAQEYSNPRDKLEGSWKGNDTPLKSTMDYYDVYITPDPDDSTMIFIDGFNGLGLDVTAHAKLSGMTITLDGIKNADGYTFKGSGVVSSNYKEIDWNYSTDIGDGILDKYTAVFTKN
jgi:hypothetical protein